MSATYRIELADFELVWRDITNMALDPCKNSLYYVLPIFGAFSSGCTPIVPSDYGQQCMIPQKASEKVHQEVETLRKCAELQKKIGLYTALHYHFISFGGLLSLTEPVIVIPYHRIFRPDKGYFGDNALQDTQDICTLTDDETRFYIAREIGHLKYNDVFLKILAKIALLSSLFFFYTTPLGWVGTAVLASNAFAMYVIVDRIYECTLDQFAAKIHGEAIGDPKRATAAAISALEKQRAENFLRRKNNWFCSFYLTNAGNNLLDIKHPFLTNRIESLRKSLEMLS